MPALLDIALAILVLTGAFFMGSAAYALVKELRKDNDNNKTPPAGQ